jgi:hypothetical protein
MAKRHSTRRRGGAWYNPFTWFSTAPETASVGATPAPPAPGSPSLSGSPSTAPVNPPYGGKKRSKTRRGGRRQRNLSKKIYGTH